MVSASFISDSYYRFPLCFVCWFLFRFVFKSVCFSYSRTEARLVSLGGKPSSGQRKCLVLVFLTNCSLWARRWALPQGSRKTQERRWGKSEISLSAGGVGGCFEGKSLLSLRASITANADGHHRPAGLRGPRPAEDWPLAACWGYSRERQTRLRTSHGGVGGAGAGGLGGCPAPRNRRKPLLRERVPAHTSALPFWFQMETCLFLPFPS